MGVCRLIQDDAQPHAAYKVIARGQGVEIALSGDWIAQAGRIPVFPQNLFDGGRQSCAVTMQRVGKWDSGLIAFLWDAKCAAAAAHRSMDCSGLPQPAQMLLDLLPDHDLAPPAPPRRSFAPISRLGGAAIGLVSEIGAISLLLAQTATGAARAMRGTASMRGQDFLRDLRDAGPSALLIVSVVNFLVGAILAFVGAAQLRKFAAEIYVANLVGLALVREMASVMTAIVMSGRTGGAYAARIATMQGNEEIDALQVTGIPIAEYILLPAILALVITMPLLYLYGCVVGLFGGLLVSMAMLNVSAIGYVHQTIAAVSDSQFIFGFIKSIAFAVLIGVTSCRIGLKAGRSAADVGDAATRAVVIGIVGVIALDAVFAVLADSIGF
jgi:phospholipid/cholesterol/gamma-HCH transport system permease protein